MIEVTAYLCEHCKARKKYKKYLSKGAAKKHEKDCFYNPARRACNTCIHDCLTNEAVEGTERYCQRNKRKTYHVEFNCPLWTYDENNVPGHFNVLGELPVPFEPEDGDW